jgi:hypothetical protein
MKCPKCGYERRPTDSAPDWQCPSCNVAYVKAAPAQAAELEEDSGESEWLLSRGQKIVIHSILFNFLLRAADQGHLLPPWLSYLLYFCTAAYSLLGVVKICSGLEKSQGAKILFMVLSYFPLINLVALVYLNVQATRKLRQAGWTVGLLGARQ